MGNNFASPLLEGAIDDDPGGKFNIPILQYWWSPFRMIPHRRSKGPILNSSNIHSDMIMSRFEELIHDKDELDWMERGLGMVDDGRNSVSVESHKDKLAVQYLVPMEQEPQNINQWTEQSESSNDQDREVTMGHPRRTMARNGSRVVRVLMKYQSVSSSEKEDYPRLELMSQRYAERIYGPNGAPSTLASRKQLDVSSGGSLYVPNHWSAFLLEKAILNWSSAPRYVGLYPHSADPPIHYTENFVPEPHPHNHHTSTALYHRPGRSQATTTTSTSPNKQSPQYGSLLGAHRVSKLAVSLLSSLLQVVQAFTPFVLQYLPILRNTYLGRVYRKVALSWLYKSDLNKRLKTHTTRTSHKMDPTTTEIEELCQQWLNQDMIQENTTPPEKPQTPRPECTTELDQHLAFNNDYPLYTLPEFNSFDGSLIYYNNNANNYNHLVYIHQLSPPVSVSAPPPLDWSTPASSAYAEYEMEIPTMGINPGLSLPTSQNVTPLTEGLETPTFTPSCTPVSVASPPQQLSSPRKYFCDYESCAHKQFDRPCDLNKHLKTHQKHLECEYLASQGCQMKFSTEKDRKRHHATVHERRQDFVCHVCVKQGAKGRFSRKDNLRHHIRTVHKNELDCPK